jgi:hypothetical protein
MEEDKIRQLKEAVEKHTVHYEVSPHYEVDDAKRIMVGFDIELHGTHNHGNTRLTPGCELCTQTYADLQLIAEWVVPKEERPSEYDIPPFYPSLTESGRGPFEVVLPIRIEHRHRFLDPVDDCEQRCLAEILKNLADLGVRAGHRGRS